MREIIFRAKGDTRYNDGRWAYGVPVQYTDGDWQIHWGNSNCGGYTTVLADTIGQYTGYKDNKGEDIFEGDILCLDKRTKTYAIVRFGEFLCDGEHVDEQFNKELGFYVEHLNYKHEHRRLLYWIDDCEIVGNVYENPELVEKKQ